MLTRGTRVTLSSGARAQRVGGPWIQPNVHTNTITFRRLIELGNRRAWDHKCTLAVEDKLIVQNAWLNLQDQNHRVRPSVWGCGRIGANTSTPCFASTSIPFANLLIKSIAFCQLDGEAQTYNKYQLCGQMRQEISGAPEWDMPAQHTKIPFQNKL